MTVETHSADVAVRRATIVMIMLNSISTAMMLSAVNVALPDIARDLDIDAVILSWIPMTYLMASAAFVLAFGRLADMFGRKRLYLIGTAGVIVTSVVASCASTGFELIGGRVLQGICAAMLYATNVAIVSSVFPPAQRGQAIGYTVSTIYLGLALGPVLGGWLIELSNWRATFLIHIPLAVIVLYIGLTRLPIEWKAEERGDFDPLGAVLYGVAIVVFMVGVSTLPNVSSIGMIVAGIAGIWLFFRHEHRHPHPIFDVELFYSSRVFTMSCLASLVMYTATFANVVLVSLYLQYLKGIAPGTTGLVLMAQPLMMAVVSPAAGKLSDRLEPRVIASLGMLVTAVGLASFALLDEASSISTVVGCLLITGLGFSLFTSPNANAIMGAVGRGDYGRAAAAMAVMRVVGQMASMGSVAMVFALMLGPVRITRAVYPALGDAIATCFAIGAVFCALGIILSLTRGRMHAPA
ncbi:MAG: MFS transporter [Gammaproteobacteria bacterium]|nr:MFS transporter [Gammaproteobacteria bacterium]